MNQMLTVFGTTMISVVLWLSGLFYAPYFVEKLFPRWRVQKQSAVGVASYLVLTGFVLILIGKFI